MLAADVQKSEDGKLRCVDLGTTRKQAASALVDVWIKRDEGVEASQESMAKWACSVTKDVRVLEWAPSPDLFRATAMSFRMANAYSSDGLHPRQLALLPDSLLWPLINMFMKAIRDRIHPEAVRTVFMKLIGKFAPDGTPQGVRAIGLFTSTARVYLRCIRRNWGADWMKKWVPKNWYGTEGKPTERAVWSHAVAVKYAKSRNKAAAAGLFDVTKAFDHLRWYHILRSARRHGFPEDLLAMLHHMHNGTRHVVVDGEVVAKVTPSISVIAGCTFADQTIFMVMLEVDGYVKYRCPEATTAVVADDFQILMVDAPERTAAGFAKIANTTFDALKLVDLPVAMKKMATLATTLDICKKIVAKVPKLKGSVVRTTRNLGIDFTLRNRRTTQTFTARFQKAVRTAVRLKKAK